MPYFHLWILLALAFALVFTNDGRADIVLPDLAPGTQFRVIFVTTTETAPTYNTFSHYDSIVASDAAAGGINTYAGNPVSWQAIVSVGSTTGSQAINRFSLDNVPIYLPDGTLVANGTSALFNTVPGAQLNHAINETANGGAAHGTAWTGSYIGGVAANEGWLGNTYTGLFSGGQSYYEYGSTGTTDAGGWLANAYGTGSIDLPIYGLSQVLTAVPEPSSLILTCAGAMSFLVAHRLRRKRPVAPSWE